MVVTEAFNFVDPVVDNFEGSMALLIEGAVLAVIVVWLFLRDGRATFVSATALPLSVIPTFGVMYLMGFTLNVVTLLSMSLVVGILVDDAIVEIEKHHAPPARGQAALPGGDGGGRRNRPRRDRHHLHTDRGFPAHSLHERRAGQVLRPVRAGPRRSPCSSRWWWRAC
jgi:hypothetical protein